MKKLFLLVFAILFSFVVFPQKNRKATDQQLRDFYVNAPVSELEKIPNPNQEQLAIIEFRKKKEKDCSPPVSSTGGYNKNYQPTSSTPKNIPTVFEDPNYKNLLLQIQVLQKGQETINNKLDNINNVLINVVDRITNMEEKIFFIDNKIDSLTTVIITMNSRLEENKNANHLIFLKKGELMIFHSEYMDLLENPANLNEFISSFNSILGVRINPLDLEDYRNGSLTGEPKLLIEKLLKTVGSIDTDDPEIVWEYFVKNAHVNAGLTLQTFKKFF